MTFIQKMDGEIIDLEEHGIRTRDFIVSAPNPIHITDTVEGGIGVIDYGTDIGVRNIKVLFRLVSRSVEGFSLKRDEVFALLYSGQPFYIIERRIYGKRWLVKINNDFDIPQRLIYGNFEVDLIGLNGFAESRGTTMDIHNNDINSISKLWSAGMGLVSDDIKKDYIFDVVEQTIFRVYNPGNLTVHPFFHDIKITIKNVVSKVGTVERFQLTNSTNGTTARINRNVGANETVVYDGADIISNGTVNMFRDTRKDYLELAPGWNTLSLYYAASATVEFDFRAYYK